MTICQDPPVCLEAQSCCFRWSTTVPGAVNTDATTAIAECMTLVAWPGGVIDPGPDFHHLDHQPRGSMSRRSALRCLRMLGGDGFLNQGWESRRGNRDPIEENVSQGSPGCSCPRCSVSCARVI